MGRKIEINKDEFLKYYNLGYGERRIAKELNCSRSRIGAERIKLGLSPNLIATRFDLDKLKELIDSGLNDREISEALGEPIKSIRTIRLAKFGKISKDEQYKNQINYYSYFDIFSDKYQLAILCGTILGDGSISKSSLQSSRGSISHKESNKDYVEYKQLLLKSISCPNLGYKVTKESFFKGKKVFGENQFTLQLKSSPYLDDLRKIIYCEEGGSKKITEKLLSLMNENSIAMHYFDDGYKSRSKARPNFYAYKITMYGFSEESISTYRQWMLDKYNIHTTVSSGVLYIRANSREQFKLIIQKHVVPSMQYKI